MAREYCLACTTCKVFLDLHKVKLVPHLCDRSPLGIEGVSVHGSEISEGMKNLAIPDETAHWVRRLLPVLESFLNLHSDHELKLMDDCEPDYWWWPEHAGYTGWKEIPGPMTNELFLPRNLVDDLQITSWEQAEDYLKTCGIVLHEELELTEYKAKMDELTGKREC